MVVWQCEERDGGELRRWIRCVAHEIINQTTERPNRIEPTVTSYLERVRADRARLDVERDAARALGRLPAMLALIDAVHVLGREVAAAVVEVARVGREQQRVELVLDLLLRRRERVAVDEAAALTGRGAHASARERGGSLSSRRGKRP